MTVSPRDPAPVPRFLQHAGENAARVSAFDWSRTPLGPLAHWSRSLKSSVASLLRSPLPMALIWGERGIMIYNDAYIPTAGQRHPDAIGAPIHEAWPEAAEFNQYVLRTVLSGQSLTYQDQSFTSRRNGTPEPVWFTLAYSPVLDDDEHPAGMLAVVIEQTAQILAEQRLSRAQEAGGVGVFSLDLTTNSLEATPEFARIFGLPSGETPDIARVGALLAPEEWQAISSARELTPEVAPLSTEYRIQRADTGEMRWISRKAEYERNELGHPVRLVGVVQDVTERRLAQRAAEQSAAEFYAFAQALPNHVWTSQPTGELDWFNDRIYEYTGTRQGELQGERWMQWVHDDDREQVKVRWAAALATGETFELEYRLRRFDGASRWYLCRALPIRDAEGNTSRWIGTNTDIHQRKLAEAESTRDRDRMWNLSQEIMLVCDFEGVISTINPAALRVLGWNADEMIGRNLGAFLHPEDIELTAAQVSRLALGYKTMHFENRYRTRDGEYRLLDWTAVPDGGFIHAVARDVTKERTSAAERERIWTTTNDLMGTVSADGFITSANPAWSRLLGYEEAEMLSLRLLDLVALDDRPRLEDVFARLTAGKKVQTIENRLLHKDGAQLLLSWSVHAVANVFYLVGRNVSEQRLVEEALRQAQKMEAVGQLTGGIAHDFNNLLQGITGSLNLVQKRIAQGRFDEVGRFIGGAMTSANRASALTHRLLAFARRQPLDPRVVRTNPLVISMEDLLRRTLGERVTLELALAPGLWLTRCDPNQLENAILNLAINARDAMPSGGALTIRTANSHLDSLQVTQLRDARPGQYVSVSVSDTGTGMSADTISKAFEPFFTTKPIGQGTGLGLSMIYGFARQSEGHATIESELERGTTVTLHLPRDRSEIEDDDPFPDLTNVRGAESDETVLVVEDEPIVRGLIVEVLGELGYQALEAADGPSGLEALQSKRRIDLLITDIGLPGLNGRQIADAARLIRPNFKVLFMTGYAENAALAAGFLEPGMSMITKPFAMEELALKIRETLQGG